RQSRADVRRRGRAPVAGGRLPSRRRRRGRRPPGATRAHAVPGLDGAVMGDWLALPGFDGFAWPWLLLALPLPLLVRWLLPPLRGHAPALRVPWPERLRAVATGGGRGFDPGLPSLALLGWVLLCVAAARPQQLGPPVAPQATGRDLMLALDLSGSMAEED